MPLSLHPVRKYPDCFLQIRKLLVRILFRPSFCKTFIGPNLFYGKFRKLFQQPSDRPLVLQSVKGTGGIHKIPSRTKHPRRLKDNAPLKLREKLRPMLFPCLYHLLILTKHPFSGTGCVNQNLIKILWEVPGKPSRLFAEHQCIADAKKLDIL